MKMDKDFIKSSTQIGIKTGGFERDGVRPKRKIDGN